MTQISAPWNSTTLGDAGPYSADRWAQIWRNSFTAGAPDENSGVLMGSGVAPDSGLGVTATGPASASVNVSAGAALVHGTNYINDATVNLAIAANGSGNPRIDTIVLRKDWTAQTVRLAVLQGTPAVSPSAPALTQTNLVRWEIALADIAVANGFATITAANITRRKNWLNLADGVYLLDVLNNTGATLETGDVVIRDAATSRAALTTTTVRDPLVMGVWVGRTAAAGYGRVLQKGIGYVNTTAAVTIGDKLMISGTAKKAEIIASAPATYLRNKAVFAIALETTTGAGLALCLVDATIMPSANPINIIKQDNNANYTTNSTVFVDVDPINLAPTLTITGSAVLITFAGTVKPSAGGNTISFDVLIDGTRYASGGADGIVSSVVGTYGPVSFAIIVSGLTAGAHTFKLQWKVIGAITATLQGGSGVGTTADPDNLVLFSAVEIG